VLAETAAGAARGFGDAVAFVGDEGLTPRDAEFDVMADQDAAGSAEPG